MEQYYKIFELLNTKVNKCLDSCNESNLLEAKRTIETLYKYAMERRKECLNTSLIVASSYTFKAGQCISWWKNMMIALDEVKKGNFGIAKDILRGDVKPTQEQLDKINLDLLDPELNKKSNY